LSTTSLSQSSSPSDELTSKYFINPFLLRPYTRIGRLSNRNSVPVQEVQQHHMDVYISRIHSDHSQLSMNQKKDISSEDGAHGAQLKNTDVVVISDICFR